MANDLVSTLLYLSKPFEVQTDALDFALRGIFVQEENFVAFLSRNLFEKERHYILQERDLLAAVRYMRVWRHYLLGLKFVVKTDNVVVSHFLTQKKSTFWQDCWQEFLVKFDLALEYKLRPMNNVVDALNCLGKKGKRMLSN